MKIINTLLYKLTSAGISRGLVDLTHYLFNFADVFYNTLLTVTLIYNIFKMLIALFHRSPYSIWDDYSPSDVILLHSAYGLVQ